MIITATKQFTVDDALRHAVAFCAAHPTWKPIFQIDEEALYSPIPWKELPGWEKRPWWNRFRDSAAMAWEEFAAHKLYRYRTGFISGAGNFYREVTYVPRFHNLCTVIEVGGRPGLYARSVEYDRSGKATPLPDMDWSAHRPV